MSDHKLQDGPTDPVTVLKRELLVDRAAKPAIASGRPLTDFSVTVPGVMNPLLEERRPEPQGGGLAILPDVPVEHRRANKAPPQPDAAATVLELPKPRPPGAALPLEAPGGASPRSTRTEPEATDPMALTQPFIDARGLNSPAPSDSLKTDPVPWARPSAEPPAPAPTQPLFPPSRAPAKPVTALGGVTPKVPVAPPVEERERRTEPLDRSTLVAAPPVAAPPVAAPPVAAPPVAAPPVAAPPVAAPPVAAPPVAAPPVVAPPVVAPPVAAPPVAAPPVAAPPVAAPPVAAPPVVAPPVVAPPVVAPPVVAPPVVAPPVVAPPVAAAFVPALDDALVAPEEPSQEQLIEVAPLEVIARPAATWRRLGAWGLDVGLYLGVVGGVAFAIGTFGGRAQAKSDQAWQQTLLGGIEAARSQWLVVAGFAALFWLFSVAFFGRVSSGRTPGRLLFGLRLVDGTGRAPSMGRSFARAVLSVFSLGLLMMGYWASLFSRQGRTLHDALTGTIVVRVSSEHS